MIALFESPVEAKEGTSITHNNTREEACVTPLLLSGLNAPTSSCETVSGAGSVRKSSLSDKVSDDDSSTLYIDVTPCSEYDGVTIDVSSHVDEASLDLNGECQCDGAFQKLFFIYFKRYCLPINR